MPVFAPPNTKNLAVGKGEIQFKPEGSSFYHHVGNVPTFTFTISVEKLDHYAPVNGMRVKDFSWTIETEAEVEMEMEELTAKNFQLMMFGAIVGNTVDIAAAAPPRGALRYTGTNEVGPRWQIDLHSVAFGNDGEYEPITEDEFSVISVTGTALAVNGSFGTMTLI